LQPLDVESVAEATVEAVDLVVARSVLSGKPGVRRTIRVDAEDRLRPFRGRGRQSDQSGDRGGDSELPHDPSYTGARPEVPAELWP
jgi:hypothetical protein